MCLDRVAGAPVIEKDLLLCQKMLCDVVEQRVETLKNVLLRGLLGAQDQLVGEAENLGMLSVDDGLMDEELFSPNQDHGATVLLCLAAAHQLIAARLFRVIEPIVGARNPSRWSISGQELRNTETDSYFTNDIEILTVNRRA